MAGRDRSVKAIGETQSVCPECLRVIPAVKTEEEDGIYLEKTCPEHGDFRALIWEGSRESYEAWGAGARPADRILKAGPSEKGCPLDCGLCEAHERRGCCVLLEVTKRCNLRCPVCFADAGEGEDISLEELANAIRPDTILVSTILVNNETGVIQDAAAIGKLIKEKNPNTLYHVDAVQAFGKYPIDVQKMKIDLLTMSGHKIHGPKGVGMVYMRKGLKVRPFILGGGQQKGQRAGTENGAGVAGLGVAADVAFRSMKESIEHVKEVKKTLMDGILAMPDTQVNGDGLEEASPYVLNVTFKGLRSEVLLHSLESKGIFVSAGSACDSRKKIGSPVLTAMGMPFEEIEGAVRFSFCRYNTVEEAKECLKALEETVPFLRKINRQR